MVNDYIALGNGLYVVEVHIKSNLQDVTLGQLLKDTKGEIDPVLVKRGKQTFIKLEHDFRLQEHDSLLLAGNRAELKYIAPRLV